MPCGVASGVVWGGCPVVWPRVWSGGVPCGVASGVVWGVPCGVASVTSVYTYNASIL